MHRAIYNFVFRSRTVLNLREGTSLSISLTDASRDVRNADRRLRHRPDLFPRHSVEVDLQLLCKASTVTGAIYSISSLTVDGRRPV